MVECVITHGIDPHPEMEVMVAVEREAIVGTAVNRIVFVHAAQQQTSVYSVVTELVTVIKNVCKLNALSVKYVTVKRGRFCLPFDATRK